MSTPLTTLETSLPDDLTLCQQMIRELLHLLQSERRDREQLQHRLDLLLRRLYGPRSEHRHPGQPLLFAEPDDVPPPPPPPPPSSSPNSPSRKGRHGRRKLPEQLRRERVVHDLTEQQQRCPGCTTPRVKIGEEISERLDYVPASLFVVEHVRPKYVCRACAGHLALAELPPEPIVKGIPAAGLVAAVIVK